VLKVRNTEITPPFYGMSMLTSVTAVWDSSTTHQTKVLYNLSVTSRTPLCALYESRLHAVGAEEGSIFAAVVTKKWRLGIPRP
jgi:hypothetical protein